MTPYVKPITAHVNEMGIVLRFNPASGLTHGEWEKLLDELRSHYIRASTSTGSVCTWT